MALSNIWREPRRELTEQLVGTMILVGVVGISYPLAVEMGSWGVNPPPFLFRLVLAPVLIGVTLFVGYLILLAIHAIGEDVCNKLARRG